MARKSSLDKDNQSINDVEIEYVSKTQLKQYAKQLRDLGEQIVDLSPQMRQQLPLNDELFEAIKLADRIRHTREGFRRQLQFIGRLLRHSDIDALQLAINRLTHTNKQGEQQLRYLSEIRQQLLEQGDSKVNELVGLYPQVERQKLRQLVKKAIKQQASVPNGPAYKALFQYLKQVIVEPKFSS